MRPENGQFLIFILLLEIRTIFLNQKYQQHFQAKDLQPLDSPDII